MQGKGEMIGKAVAAVLVALVWFGLLMAARDSRAGMLAPKKEVVEAAVAAPDTPTPSPTTDVPEVPLVAPAAPAIAGPTSGAQNVARPVTLTWTVDQVATKVELMVADDAAFTKGVQQVVLDSAKNQDLTTHVLSNLGPRQTYYWKVRAVNTVGESAWTAPASFATNDNPPQPPTVPVLTSPAAGAADLPVDVRLAWKAERAEALMLEVATDAGFAATVQAETATGASHEVKGLAQGTTYYWRVKAKNSVGETEWSKVASFTTARKVDPGVTNPGPNVPVGNLKLIWEAEKAKGISAPNDPDPDTQARLMEDWKKFFLYKLTEDAMGPVSGTGRNTLAIRKLPPGEHVEKDEVTYRLNIPRDDVYYLWGRVRWSTGCGNSVGIKIPGVTDDGKISDQTFDNMHWVMLQEGGEARQVPLKAGVITLTVFTREPGIMIDQFVLTTDKALRPAGIYKNSTPGLLVD